MLKYFMDTKLLFVTFLCKLRVISLTKICIKISTKSKELTFHSTVKVILEHTIRITIIGVKPILLSIKTWLYIQQYFLD